MPRIARVKSKSGLYHVMIRGTNRQKLFCDEIDNKYFLKVLSRYKKELGIEIHAYCLMGNHVHLLIKDTDDLLGTFMKKIAGSYAFYFNARYERVGHVFQDRFKSEPIDDDSYYLTVIRYIHQNPQKSGICNTEDYLFSSYRDYISGNGIADTAFALDILGGVAGFVDFNKKEETCQCLDFIETVRYNDQHVEKLIIELAGIDDPREVRNLDFSAKTEIILQLRQLGISAAQIERTTGVHRKFISKL